METLHTVSVVQALASSLRSRVLDGLIEPGTSLAENEVAAEFSVSRPTARAAITMLVGEGLLRRRAHRSARVPVLSRADVEDLFLVRIPLEIGVVRLVARDRILSADAQNAIDALASVPLDAPDSVFVESDLDFHRALVRAVDSPRLTRLYSALSGEIHLSMVQSRFVLGQDRIAGEHRAILEALRANEADAAETEMRMHLEGACEALARKLDAVSAAAAEAS